MVKKDVMLVDVSYFRCLLCFEHTNIEVMSPVDLYYLYAAIIYARLNIMASATKVIIQPYPKSIKG